MEQAQTRPEGRRRRGRSGLFAHLRRSRGLCVRECHCMQMHATCTRGSRRRSKDITSKWNSKLLCRLVDSVVNMDHKANNCGSCCSCSSRSSHAISSALHKFPALRYSEERRRKPTLLPLVPCPLSPSRTLHNTTKDHVDLRPPTPPPRLPPPPERPALRRHRRTHGHEHNAMAGRNLRPGRHAVGRRDVQTGIGIHRGLPQ